MYLVKWSCDHSNLRTTDWTDTKSDLDRNLVSESSAEFPIVTVLSSEEIKERTYLPGKMV
jgi:hypothetical protein